MIQAAMFITLGFLAASLAGILIAPSLWRRAYRLSRKRLEQTLPMSLSEIEAAQDQVRAASTVKLRRLETALASAKQKAALQRVDNSRLQMQIAALKDTIESLDLKLSERVNAATVLEQTITKRVPALEGEIALLKAQLTERAQELRDVTNRLSRRDEALEAAQRGALVAQEEVTRLRQALEKSGGDRGGRRLRRPSQWNLDDYRAEYDRLNLDLSKLRQQLTQFQERDAQQVSLIKGDLQKLAELILNATQPRQAKRSAERPETPVVTRTSSDFRRDLPLPWPQTPLAAGTAQPKAARNGPDRLAAEKQAQPSALATPVQATAMEQAPAVADPPEAGDRAAAPVSALSGADEKALAEPAEADGASESAASPQAPGTARPKILTRSTGSGVPETALSLLRSLPQNKRDIEGTPELDSISDVAEAFWGSGSAKKQTGFGGKPSGAASSPPSDGFAFPGPSTPSAMPEDAEVPSNGIPPAAEAGSLAPITAPPVSQAQGDGAASPFAFAGDRMNGVMDDFAAGGNAPAPGENSVKSEKAFSDAKELRALSELLSMSGEGGGGKAAADAPPAPGVAEEASRGMVLDLKPLDSVAAPEAEKAPRDGKTPIRTLLDRLRGLGSEPPEAGPAADPA